MLTDEMKQSEHYRMYTEVFGIDVPMIQSQPTEFTHGMNRTTSAPRSSNPYKEVAESSAPRRSTVIRLRLPERRSTLSLAEHKSREEQEARENVALVAKHLASEEIKKMVDEQENIVEIAKEKEVEITQEKEVEITNVIIPVNVTDEDEEITDEVYELKRREKGKNVEETRNSPIPTPIRSPRIHTNLVSSDTEKLQELTDTPHTTSSSSSPHKKLTKTNRLLSLFKTKPTRFKCYKSFFHELQGCYGYLFAHLRASLAIILHVYPAQSQTSSVPEQQYQLYLAMKVDPQLKHQDIAIWLALQIKFERNTVLQTACRTSAVCPRDQDDPHDDAHPEGENSAKRQKTSEYKAYKGNSGPEKIVLSLHKFPAIIFNDDDIEERTFRWVNKSVKKFNPYAQYVIKTYWELGHEHKFITEIVARRANDCIVSITNPDYKNLNKNNIEDIYLLIMNGNIPDYADTRLLCYQQKVNLTAPTITFPGIEEHDMFSIIYEPVHGIIYKNSKKEKRVMRHTEIHKFCDAMLNRVLEGLKSYNNDVKYGYVQKDLTKDETEYLKLFEEEIEEI
ncbi:hypothetical protein Tco_0451149 [Tanacetum coccineum]